MQTEYNKKRKFRANKCGLAISTPAPSQGADLASGSTSVAMGTQSRTSLGVQPAKRMRPSLLAKTSALAQAPQPMSINNTPDSISDLVAREKKTFKDLAAASLRDGNFGTDVNFDQLKFYNKYKDIIPIHTLVWRADCACNKLASANVEGIFAGAATLLSNFHAGSMSADVLELYIFVHSNWKYEWLRPSDEEILNAYQAKYGSAASSFKLLEENSDSDQEEEESEKIE